MLHTHLSLALRVEEGHQWNRDTATIRPVGCSSQSIQYTIGSRSSAVPPTGFWEFLKLIGLRETDWLPDSQDTDVYIRMLINVN